MFNDSLSYSELQTKLSALRTEYAPGLKNAIAKLLVSLESSVKVADLQRDMQSINGLALKLSALDSKWVEFSNTVFEHVLLPPKTAATGVVKKLRNMFEERENYDSTDV